VLTHMEWNLRETEELGVANKGDYKKGHEDVSERLTRIPKG